MAKVKGSGMSFIFDGTSIPIKSLNVDTKYESIDVTDTSTSGDTVEEIRSRVTNTIKADGIAIVSAAKKTGKVATFTFNGTAYYLTDCSFDESYNEHDSTDTGVAEPYTEFDVTYAKRTGKFTGWLLDTTAEPALNTDGTCLMTFTTGYTVSGIGALDGKTIDGSVDGKVKYDMSIVWKSASKTLPGVPVTGTAKPCTAKWKDGATDKASDGTAIFTGVSVSANVKGPITWSATGKFNGAVTETQFT